MRQEYRKLEKEITPETEWIQMNDTELKFVDGNWPGVIELCINNNFYPKVLFYEKLHSTEDDVEYKPSRAFNMTKKKLEDLALLACDLDRYATASMEDLYGLGEADMQA